MTLLYGLLGACLALVVLVATVWAVDRLDAADRGEKRVWWRPWYRTAIAGGVFCLIGLLGRGGVDIAFVFALTFLVLLTLQLWTGSGLKLHYLETLALLMCFFGGIALMHWLDPEASDSPDLISLRRAFYICIYWFLLFSAIGTVCITIRRILVRWIKKRTARNEEGDAEGVSEPVKNPIGGELR